MALSKAPYTFKRTNTDKDDPVMSTKLANRFNNAMALALFPNPSASTRAALRSAR